MSDAECSLTNVGSSRSAFISAPHWLGWAVFIAVASIAYLKLYIGVDITDESQYLAQTWLPITGGQPLVNDLFLQQMAQWVILPLCALYSALFHFEGIALVLRHLFWVMSVGGALIWCLSLLRERRCFEAYLQSAIFIAFIPFSVPSWSYNTVAQVLPPLSMLLLLRPQCPSRRWPVTAGALAAIASFSYPTMAVVCALFLVLVICLREATGRAVIWYCIGGACALTLLSTWFLIFGVDNLPRVISFTREFGALGGLIKFRMLSDQLLYSLPVESLVLFTVAVVGVLLDRRTKLLPIWLLLILGVFWTLGDNSLTRQKAHGYIFYGVLAMSIFNAALRARLGAVATPRRWRIILTCSVVSGCLVGYSSSNGLINCAIGFLPAFVILLFELCSLLDSCSTWKRFRCTWSVALCLLALSMIGYHTWVYVYGTGPTMNSYAVVRRGPFKGIFTAPWKAAMLAEFQDDIEKLAQGRETIFAAYFAPAYFSTHLTPVTSMLNIHPLQFTEAMKRAILKPTVEGGIYPDIVVNAKTHKPELTRQFEDFFVQSGRYQLVKETPFYSLFSREN